MAKKRPTIKALQAARRRHWRHEHAETIAYAMYWPDKSAILEHAWRASVTFTRIPHWRDYIDLLAFTCPNLDSGDT